MSAIDVLDEDLSPREAVLKGLSNYIDLAARNRGHYQLIFGVGDSAYTRLLPAQSRSVRKPSTG